MRADALNSYIELPEKYPSGRVKGTYRLVIWSVSR
jgi:hypothetical protein